ncbi:MarR family winged helix-turn-helix transcriptional regulator [Kribbella sp. GL6]|uniref:MarR family winged helix-turn-helix transcriptional regulator n=1 Tax=Kribbella sp. GL6 TaxID=3419765 RepID=UPI003D043F55
MENTSRLANQAWEALLRAESTLAREYEHEGEWDDLLPREYGVLYALARARDGLRIIDLCADALLTQAGVSRLVARLERRGLVERTGDPHDGRASRIRLTPDGRDVRRRVGRNHGRHVNTAMTRALSPEQLTTLRDLCLALTEAATTRPDRNPQ